MFLALFRLALLSGEVETQTPAASMAVCWQKFRLALLSGEVETGPLASVVAPVTRVFRLALLSGEVETRETGYSSTVEKDGSGWLCYPGKLKLSGTLTGTLTLASSGWLCYPGKLKLGTEEWLRLIPGPGSGRLCYPGKLKHQRHGGR